MPKPKKAEAPASAETPVVQKDLTNANAFERGTPIEEYAERLRASQSVSNTISHVRGRVAEGLEGQGYPDADIYRVVKNIK